MAKKIKKLSDKQKLRNFFAEAMLPLRTEAPRCRHFGECGGCEFQDVAYSDQLRVKRRAFDFIAGETLRDCRDRATTLETAEDADPAAGQSLRENADRLEAALAGVDIAMVPSPLPYGYRQRMDYVFAFGKAGLRRASRHRQVVELEECPLLGDQGFAVFQKAKSLAVAAGLESYDYMRHTGELRYFVVRRSRNGGNLLSLVTKSRAPAEAVAGILRRLVDGGDIVSGHWLLADGLGDVSFGEPLANVGEPWIVEDMNGFGLRIGPNTFFQSNPAVAEHAYAAIRDFVPAGGEVFDMYSGVGSIAVNVSPTARVVAAVENMPENVELARANIRENDIENIRLHRDDSAAYLRSLLETAEAARPDMVVVNPPRPGVEGDGMRSIKRLGPERLAYLSCNPFTLLRNLLEVVDEYALRALTIYDMFPQTRHFESLASLEKKG